MQIPEYLLIAESEDAQVQALEKLLPLAVQLDAVWVIVNLTIQLHDQALIGAEKVDYVSADSMLTPKLSTVQLSVA